MKYILLHYIITKITLFYINKVSWFQVSFMVWNYAGLKMWYDLSILSPFLMKLNQVSEKSRNQQDFA